MRTCRTRTCGTLFCLTAVWVVLALPPFARATHYEVGPDKQYATIDLVPWESLAPGDIVSIHWRPQPYRAKWVICRRGLEKSPITVRGIPGPQRQLPVIDGRNAITRPALDYWGGERGVVKIGGANLPVDATPAYIVIEGLDIRSGRAPYLFLGRDGFSNYVNNAAAIYIEKGEHITIRGCILRDSGNGLFVAASSKQVLIDGCGLWNNGIENSIYEHNSYTAAMGMTHQGNRFGPLRKHCLGNNLKDRSAGLVVRHNWIEDGNRQLDLVDAEDSEEVRSSPLYRQTFVYGNVLLEVANRGNNQIVHYGGDSGQSKWYRKGTLYFHNNTVVSERQSQTTLFCLSTNDEHIDCRNNIFYSTTAGRNLALLDDYGRADLNNNWFKRGWVNSHESFKGRIRGRLTSLTGAEPGFVDASARKFRLRTDSPCRAAGIALHSTGQKEDAAVLLPAK